MKHCRTRREQKWLRAAREWGPPVAACLCILIGRHDAVPAATVTPQVRVALDGTLSGPTYTLGAGELDTTGTFAANGSVTIAGSVADVPGNLDPASGFYFDATSLGSLTTQNWLAEVVFSPDVPIAGQPGALNHFLDVQGDTFFRYGGAPAKATEFGFFDGTTESIDNTVTSPPTNQFSHLALTWAAASNTLEAFVDGVSQGTLSTGTAFTTPSNRVGFGFFARDGFIGRAVDGKLDAMAFATFTGTFDPGTDFQIVAPESPLTATVDRDPAGTLGSVTITNVSGGPLPIAGYSVTSVAGALDQTNWNKITAVRDAPGGNGGGDGSIDSDDDWVVLSDPDSESDLSEFEISFPGGDGGVLGAGASLSLGNVWRKVPGSLEDVVVAVADPTGNAMFVPISYTGNVGNSFPIGDLDFDGDVDAIDWQSYLAAAQSDLNDLTVAEAYRQGGDLNSDGASDILDLDAFITSFDASNGSGSFAAMVATVPEPSSLAQLAALAACVVGFVMGRARCGRMQNWWQFPRTWNRAAAAAICLALCWGAIPCVTAATVTQQVLVNFDGTLNGTTYMLGAGELDTTGTFSGNGSATVASGVGDVPGDVDSTSGFYFDSTSLGALPPQNWVTEAVFVPDVPVPEQPNHGADSGGARNNHILDVRGDTFYRFRGEDLGVDKFTEFGYWDGATETRVTAADPPTNRFSHVGLVWNAANTSLEAFQDGVSQGVVDLGSFDDSSSPYVGYGFFSRYIQQAAVGPRAIDGKLASVAFSTFTGDFVSGFGEEGDFQLDPTDAPSLVLELDVNTVTGHVSIVNNTLSAVSIQGYEVTSPGGSLDVSPGGWLSLADQKLDPVMGGDDPGEAWAEGENPSQFGFLEGFLLGSSTLDPGEIFTLGRAYDESADAQDLAFRYRLASVSGVIDGLINYDDTPPMPVDGDYNDDGVVNAADFVVWRNYLNTSTTLPNDTTPGMVTQADYEVWVTNFGATGGAGSGASGSAAVPEPSAAVILLVALGLLSIFGLRQRTWWTVRAAPAMAPVRRSRPVIYVAAMVLFLAARADAYVTLDRVYRLGDDDNDNGIPSSGVTVGNTTSTGDTFDSEGSPGTGTLVDLTPNGGPVYANVTGRPQLAGSGLGIQFDGVNDFVTGFRLGEPASSVSSTGSTQNNPANPSVDIVGTLDYSNLSDRGFQLWVRPAAAGQGTSQSVVLDTNQHGVSITENNRWALRYGGADTESDLAVTFDAWHHVMVVRPFGAQGGARMYVDGNAVAFDPGGYNAGDATYLTLGASTGDLADGVAGNEPGQDEFFTGTLDDFELFVLGLNAAAPYGRFNLQTDNSFIANTLTGMPLGDVNLDGSTNQTDADVFVDHWSETKTVNGMVLGDLESRSGGDFNFDGVIDIFDAVVLHQGLLAAGVGSGLDFGSLVRGEVPEPPAAILGLLLAGLCGGGRWGRPPPAPSRVNRAAFGQHVARAAAD